jgi:NAD(P)H-flavin reductase
MLPRPFRVVRHHLDTDDTVTLSLEPLDGPALEFAPGQFTMLHAFGVGEVPISISGDPTWPGPLVHTIRDVGNVTHALVGCGVGAVVGVRGPYGRGWDVADGTGGDVLLAAGGIGLAPLRPVLWEIADRRATFERVVLLYGARSPSEVLFGPDLERWAQEYGIEVEVTVDYAPPTWQGRVGPVTKLISRAGFDPHHTLALLSRGVSADRVRLSMERNMKCGVGLCGHCQLRDLFICVDGPVLPYTALADLLDVWEL